MFDGFGDWSSDFVWIKKVFDSIQRKGFWILIILLIGIFIGIFSSIKMLEAKVEDSIKLGGIIHKNVVYDIKVRP